MRLLSMIHFLGLPLLAAKRPAHPARPVLPVAAGPAMSAPAPDVSALLAAERAAERARCAAIMDTEQGRLFAPLAVRIACNTNLSAGQAAALLDAHAKDRRRPAHVAPAYAVHPAAGRTWPPEAPSAAAAQARGATAFPPKP